MPTTIEVKLYKFDKLSNKAKEKAKDWYREVSQHDPFHEFVYDDFKEVAARLGFDIGTRTENYHIIGGKSGSRQRDTIYFSGFASQGDGACFEGIWQPHPPLENSSKKTFPTFLEAIKDHAPQDETLHGIAIQLDKARKWVADHNGAGAIPGTKSDMRVCNVTVKITQKGNYCHDGCMDFDFRDNEWEDSNGNRHDLPDWFEPLIISEARDLAKWLYKQLEAAHDDYFDDENIAEAIRCSEYDFEEDGTRSRHNV
jgi:hypothetical protein